MCACSLRFTGTHDAARSGEASPPPSSKAVATFISSVTASDRAITSAEEGRCSDVLHKHQHHTQENEGEGKDEDETDTEDLRSRSVLRVEGVLQSQTEQ